MIPVGNQKMFAFVNNELRAQKKIDTKIAKVEAGIKKMAAKAQQRGELINEYSLAIRNTKLAELRMKSIPMEDRTRAAVQKYIEKASK